MINPAIVVIAYNRIDSLKRLLGSLSDAKYESDDVNLVISIDKSDSTLVADFAKEFQWLHGDKRVIEHEQNLGLKKHVLECGNLVNEYDNIIVLEDDLFVSKDFYSYACAALDFSSSDEKIAGVSLYNHMLNVHVREPFEAIDDGFDNYYMQFAQSWGQAYTKSQWNGFINWLNDNDNKDISGDNVPVNVSTWSDKSWLKYYIKYVIEANKFFIYPRASYTTNFGDEGTHASEAVADLQVPLAACKNRQFNFSTLNESSSVYDSFFENVSIDKNITFDLYGYKSNMNNNFILSCNSLPYKIVKSYGRRLRPIDANIIYNVEGDDFYLYDTSENGTAPDKKKLASRIMYNYKALNVKRMMEVLKYRILK